MTLPMFALNAQQSLKNGDLSMIRHIQKGFVNQYSKFSTYFYDKGGYCYAEPTISLSGFNNADKMMAWFDGIIYYGCYWPTSRETDARRNNLGITDYSKYAGSIAELKTNMIKFEKVNAFGYEGNRRDSNSDSQVNQAAQSSNLFIKGYYQVIEFY